MLSRLIGPSELPSGRVVPILLNAFPHLDGKVSLYTEWRSAQPMNLKTATLNAIKIYKQK